MQCQSYPVLVLLHTRRVSVAITKEARGADGTVGDISFSTQSGNKHCASDAGIGKDAWGAVQGHAVRALFERRERARRQLKSVTVSVVWTLSSPAQRNKNPSKLLTVAETTFQERRNQIMTDI